MFSYFSTGSHSCFCSWVSALVCHDFLYSPVLGAAICPVSFPLMDPGRVGNFSVCSAFYLLVQTSKLLTCRTRNWKSYLEILNQKFWTPGTAEVRCQTGAGGFSRSLWLHFLPWLPELLRQDTPRRDIMRILSEDTDRFKRRCESL